MKLGVGICTRNRPVYLEKTVSKLCEYQDTGNGYPYDIFIADDGSEDKEQVFLIRTLVDKHNLSWNEEDRTRQGVARNKNRILRHFSDCDYIVIFEDDVWPIDPDWFKVHILTAQVSMIHHFNYVPHSMIETHRHLVKNTFSRSQYFLEGLDKTVTVCQTGGTTGVFLFYSKLVLQKVGGFDSRFYPYGYQHVEFSDRIRDPRIGLSPPHGYSSLLDCESYIYWDSSAPSILGEDKKKVLADQKRLWDKIREEDFLFRSL